MTKLKRGLIGAVLALVIGGPAFGQAAEQWDALATRVLGGEKLPAETIATADKAFIDYYNRLKEQTKAKGLYQFSDQDNADHYVNAVRMGVINPAKYGNWTVYHDGRRRAFAVIRTRLETEDNPALMAAAIVPAIDNDDAPFGIAVYKRLQEKSPAWAKHILNTVRQQYSYVETPQAFLDAVAPQPPGQPKWADAIGPRRASECNGQCYQAGMTSTALRASPDIDITKPDLPKPLAEIIEIAFAKLETVAGSRKGWTHTEVQFVQAGWAQWEPPDPVLANRWYYIVEFSTKVRGEGAFYPRDANFYVPITVNGRLGGIWESGEKRVILHD